MIKNKIMNDKIFDAIISLIEQGKKHKIGNVLKNLSKSRRDEINDLLEAMKLLELEY